MMPMLPFVPPPSVANAYARVDKATSEFLNSPDWRINIGICDTINSKPWLAKDYIKSLRGRLQHKNPNVQLLSLTLLETILKNCSENVHSQIAERKILQEMIKIVKKKTHMRVREKILVLIDTWQEAFSGRGGKITAQYYRAYEELRRCGVDFPHRSPNTTVPVITPPVSYQAAAGPSTRHEPIETVSLSGLDSMRNALDLLYEMLQAVDPRDRKAVKDEIIIDLYDQCRSNQKKLGYTLSSTTDEEILHQGILFNDALQYVIEQHDAIASGSPLPVKPSSFATQLPRARHVESKDVNQKAGFVSSASIASSSSSNEIQEDESYYSKACRFDTPTVVSSEDLDTTVSSSSASKADKNPASDPSLAMALVPSDLVSSETPPPSPSPSPPSAPSKKTAEDDMIDLLSLALTPTNPNQAPDGSTVLENQPQVQPPTSSYVVPWAQTQPPLEYDPQQPSQAVQQQTNYVQPPWAPTPGYYCNPYASNHSPAAYYPNSSGSNQGLNPYIPSYRLFEDLNVLGNMRTSGTPGTSRPSMLASRK